MHPKNTATLVADLRTVPIYLQQYFCSYDTWHDNIQNLARPASEKTSTIYTDRIDAASSFAPQLSSNNGAGRTRTYDLCLFKPPLYATELLPPEKHIGPSLRASQTA